MSDSPWSHTVRLSEFGVGRAAVLRADEAICARIAEALGLAALHRLEATVKLKPWLDGGELQGAWTASIVQTCGVSLEDFEQAMEGGFAIRVLPPGSPNAPQDEGELAFDPDAEDPPDVLEGDAVDVAAYVVEHLALELDPFPREPGVEFTPPEPEAEASPFAALAALKPRGPSDA